MAESSHASNDDLDLDNPPFPLTAIDRQVLATKDEDFHLNTWDDLRKIIGMLNSISHQRLDPNGYPRREQTRSSQTETIRPPQVPSLVLRHQGSIRQHQQLRTQGAASLDTPGPITARISDVLHPPLLHAILGFQGFRDSQE